MMIVLNLLVTVYDDKACRDPLILYVCDNKEGSIELRNKKPFNENNIVDAHLFYKFIRQSTTIITKYLDKIEDNYNQTLNA